MEETNPYAPPSTGDPSFSEEKYPWFTAARAVFARDGAELPEVDLESGDPAVPLVRSTRTLVKSKPAASVALIVGAVALSIFAPRFIDNWIITILFFSYGLRIAYRFILPDLWLYRVKITLHTSHDVERFRKRMIAAHLVAAILPFVPAFFVPAEYRVPVLVMGIVALRFIAKGLEAFALKRHPVEIHFSEGHLHWVRLSGIHRDALARLKQIEVARDAEG